MKKRERKNERKYNPPIVIQVDSDFIRCGFPGHKKPDLICLTVIGCSKTFPSTSEKVYFIGKEALKKRDKLNVFYPINDRKITNWDAFEKLLKVLYVNILKMNSSDHPLLLVLPNSDLKAGELTRILKFLFDGLNVPALYLIDEPKLVLSVTKRTIGLVVNIGFHSICCTPYYKLFQVTHAINISQIGTADVSKYLMQKILYQQAERKGSEVDDRIKMLEDHQFIQDIREQLEHEVQDIFFNPSLIGKNGEIAIHDLIYTAIGQCSIDIRSELYGNIIISGEKTIIRGLKELLNKQLAKLVPSPLDLDLKEVSIWQAACTFASKKKFISNLITKEQYDNLRANSKENFFSYPDKRVLEYWHELHNGFLHHGFLHRRKPIHTISDYPDKIMIARSEYIRDWTEEPSYEFSRERVIRGPFIKPKKPMSDLCTISGMLILTPYQLIFEPNYLVGIIKVGEKIIIKLQEIIQLKSLKVVYFRKRLEESQAILINVENGKKFAFDIGISAEGFMSKIWSEIKHLREALPHLRGTLPPPPPPSPPRGGPPPPPWE
ncbi:MAG: hypothetical protein ACFFDN_13900 [Candidatus Hodarchaeota archaeon]